MKSQIIANRLVVLSVLSDRVAEHLAEEALQDVKLCNCAECNRELLGINQPDNVLPLVLDLAKSTPLVAGRIKGRPYCLTCLDSNESGNHGSFERFNADKKDSQYNG